MNIGYVMTAGKGDMDRLLFQVGERLQSLGKIPCGVVQINSEAEVGGPCDMDVRVLPDGPVLRISQNLGRESRGCRLDAEALENAVELVNTRLTAGVDCLIINKFGKQEAAGRGFRATIAEALAQDLPVLVGLNALNEEAFLIFTDGLAEHLPDDRDQILAWMVEKTTSAGGQSAA
ncbi:MAG: DUF2478 domain-containing protein [Paracoccaceae bacterium]